MAINQSKPKTQNKTIKLVIIGLRRPSQFHFLARTRREDRKKSSLGQKKS